MAGEEIRIRRADKLPASVQKELNIFDGLVEIKVHENSPKTIDGVKQSTALFSQRFAEAYRA